jgi:hypothetical protein
MIPDMLRRANVPAQCRPVFERIQQVSRRQTIAQGVFYPAPHLVGRLWSVPVHPQLPHVLVQRRYRRHGGRVGRGRLLSRSSKRVWAQAMMLMYWDMIVYELCTRLLCRSRDR